MFDVFLLENTFSLDAAENSFFGPPGIMTQLVQFPYRNLSDYELYVTF